MRLEPELERKLCELKRYRMRWINYIRLARKIFREACSPSYARYENVSSIYRIACIPNQRVYIGKAQSTCLRFISHKSDLRRGCHDNKCLQEDWNKYGESNFLMEVLEEHIKLPFETVKEFNSYILQREKEVLFTQRNAYNKAFVSSQAKTLKTLKKTGG